MSTSTCRICFEDNKKIELISPCKCSGTSAWVHRECLDKWRCHNMNNSLTRCTECLTDFEFEDIQPDIFFKMYALKHYCLALLVFFGYFLTVLFIINASCLVLAVFVHGYVYDQSINYDYDTFSHSYLVATACQLFYTAMVMFIYWETKSYGSQFPFHAFSIFSFPFIALVYLGSITNYHIRLVLIGIKKKLEHRKKTKYSKVKCLSRIV